MSENPPAGQKAKMLAGQPYMASDPELSAAHLRAQAMLARFNATSADADAERRTLLTELFERIGEGTVLKPTLRCDYGFNIAIGDRTFINYDCLLLDCNRITIGDEVQIAPGVHTTRRHTRSTPRRGAPVLSPPCLSRSEMASGLVVAPWSALASRSERTRSLAQGALSPGIYLQTPSPSATPVGSSANCEEIVARWTNEASRIGRASIRRLKTRSPVIDLRNRVSL